MGAWEAELDPDAGGFASQNVGGPSSAARGWRWVNEAAGALIGAIAGAIAGGALGNSADHQDGTIYGRPLAAVPAYPAFAGAPEIIYAQPVPGSIWVPGYWEWTGAQYTWMAGYWAVPPPGFRLYVEGGWVLRSGGYFYSRPHWR